MNNPTPLTFTERFKQVEENVNNLIQYSENIQKAIEYIQDAQVQMFVGMRNNDNDLDMLRLAFKAMIELTSKAETVSEDSISNLVTQYKADAVKLRLDSDIKAGLLTPIESVEDVKNVVSFKTKDTLFGAVEISSVATADEFTGKKVGDVVGEYEILGVFKFNPPAETPNEKTE